MISSFLAPLPLVLLGFIQGPTPPTTPPARVSDNGSATLVIRTPEGKGSTSKMVPDMHFVVLPLEGGPLDEPVLKGVTDADGRALIELPAGTFRISATGKLWARVFLREQGKQARRGFYLHPKNPEYGANVLSIAVFDGCTSFVRTVDSSDAPVDTRLILRKNDGDYFLVKKGVAERYMDLPDGWHMIHHVSPLQLNGKASAKGVGTARFSDLELDCETNQAPIKVVLSGKGVLRGTVVDQNGRPAAGVPLEFNKRGLGQPHDPETPGNYYGTATTDINGGFLIRGVQPDTYKVRSPNWSTPKSTEELLESLRFEANGNEIKIVLSRIILEVRLLSCNGRPWTSGSVNPGMPDYFRLGTFSEPAPYPESATIIVTRVGSPENASLASDRQVEGNRISDRLYVFEVESGQEYWVGAFGHPFAPVFQKVRIESDQPTQQITLQAEEEIALGTISLGPIRTPTLSSETPYRADTSISIETIPEGIPLLTAEDLSGSEIQAQIPTGRYRIVAKGTTPFRLCGMSAHEPRRLGFEDSIIDIRPNETTVMGMGLKKGALLKATVLSEPGIQLPLGETRQESFFDSHPRTEPYAKLHLEHPTRRSVRVPHYEQEGHALRVPTNFWPLNQTTTSECLPYGDYTLVVTRCDGKVERRPVELRSGETTDITVQISR